MHKTGEQDTEREKGESREMWGKEERSVERESRRLERERRVREGERVPLTNNLDGELSPVLSGWVGHYDGVLAFVWPLRPLNDKAAQSGPGFHPHSALRLRYHLETGTGRALRQLD